MTRSALTNGVQLTSDSDARTAKVDHFIVHHAATTDLSAILSLFQPGGREVSANYALGNDGTLINAVDEDRRAWTSASSYWDGRAVTIEVANSVAGGSWPVSDASFDKLARLIADVATRYGFPINDDTILTHQELYTRYGDSYATACPGDLQRRKAELIASAQRYQSGSAPASLPLTRKDSKMYLAWSTDGTGWLVTEDGWQGLPSMQVYTLFKRLINSNQANAQPEMFLRAEVDMMNNQLKLVAKSVQSQVTLDPIKLASALRDELVKAGIPVTVENLQDADFTVDPEQLAAAFEAAVPRVSAAIVREAGTRMAGA